MEYLAFLNSPWFQMLAPIGAAYASYRFPKATGSIVNVLALALSFLKAPEAPKPPSA